MANKPRGKGKRQAMAHVNLRLPEDVLDYYKQYPNYTQMIREVLIKFKEEESGNDGHN